MIAQDGQMYSSASEVPDIGSWVAYKVSDGNVREYVGLSADVSKLPVYSTTAHGELLGGGSTALCSDTSDVFIYNPSDLTWYAL